MTGNTSDGVKLQVSVVIPTVNELIGLKWCMPQIKKEWYDELIIVDGGSTDGTVEWCRQNGYHVVQQSGKGLPSALVVAFNCTSKDIIITISPDGNSLPELIPRLVETMRKGYDMVIVSRHLGSAKSEDDDFITWIGNKMFTAMINILFGGRYTDALVIFRAYRRHAIEKMQLHRQEEESRLKKAYWLLNGWEIGSSIRAAKMKMKVTEIPGDEPKRIGGTRKMSIIVNGFGALFQIIYERIIGLNFLMESKHHGAGT